ncbi:DJ-1 family protein [Solemya velesiana gill symbiont]|uniref:DJ-1 family protein n=1 Tax=Solemya velesiana gill symbiont TaxID=1918948 RepID=A0A1T2KWP8_9GAMM|nr:DJ-1 family protein [Solemya velesiana gill symbiont]
MEVVTAGLEAGEVKASRGVVLLPDTTLDQVMDQAFDMIILPGGLPGSDHLDNDPRIHELLKRMHSEGGYTAAICAAPKVLASSGLLDGRKATGYPGVLDGMDLPQVDVDLQPVIRDSRVITSRGPGTAMDFALELIEVLEGKAKRDEVEAALVRP